MLLQQFNTYRNSDYLYDFQNENSLEPTAPPMEPSETEVNSMNLCISELSEHLSRSKSNTSINNVEQNENNKVDPSSFVTVIEVNGQKPAEVSTPPPVRKTPPK